MRGQIDKKFRDKRTESIALAKTKATEQQWYLLDVAIGAFIKKYPIQWYEFQRMLSAERSSLNPYKLATKEHKEMRDANWRNVATFPTIEDKDGNVVDSLLPELQKIIPGLTTRYSVNFPKFIKKYTCFLPGERY